MNEEDLKELKKLEEKYKSKKVDINFKKVERVVKAIKVLIVGTLVPLILILALIVVIAFFIIYMYWHVDKSSMIGHLEEIYPDKYTIISEELNEEGDGYYKIAIKGNEEIVFNGYHEGNNTNIEDSQAHKLKYYFEHLDNEELKNKFTANESYYKVKEEDEQKFLKYDLKTYISNYEEIDEAVSNCYQMLQYLKEKEIYGYAMENKVNTNEIPKEDIEKYYKPSLTIVLNGEELKEYNEVDYNYEIGEYEIRYFARVIDNVESVEKLLYDSGNVIKLKYNGEEYKLHYDNNELEKNNIPYVCRISYIEEIFNANVTYDIENRKVYINII